MSPAGITYLATGVVVAIFAAYVGARLDAYHAGDFEGGEIIVFPLAVGLWPALLGFTLIMLASYAGNRDRLEAEKRQKELAEDAKAMRRILKDNNLDF